MTKYLYILLQRQLWKKTFCLNLKKERNMCDNICKRLILTIEARLPMTWLAL